MQLSVCQFNVGFGVNPQKLANILTSDIVCIEEMTTKSLGHFLEKLHSKYPFYEKSPRGRSAVLSKFPLEYVVVKVLDLYLTCFHLDSRKEEKRLK